MQRFIRGRKSGSALLTVLFGFLMVLGVLVPVAHANHPALSCLDVEPETASNTTFPPNNEHTVTATMKTNALVACEDPEMEASNGAVKISFEIVGPNDPNNDGDSPGSPDEFCNIPEGESSCTMSYTGTKTGTDTIRGWIDHDGADGTVEADTTEGQDEDDAEGGQPEPDQTDVVTKTWETRLDCSPEEETNPVGQSHTVTCQAKDPQGNAVQGVPVDVEATGTNDPDSSNSPESPDFFCTTDANGSCSFTHGPGGTGTSNDQGTTTYRAWVDSDDDDNTTEADATEGRDETTTAGSKPEPDDTDVVEKAWTFEPLTLDCDDPNGPDTERELNPSGGPSSSEVYTCRVSDAAGNPLTSEDTQVKGEVENTVNDPDSNPEGATYASPDYSCQTTNAGECQITVTQADSETGTAEICFWIGDGDQGAALCGDEPTGENQDLNGSDSGNDKADQVEKTWELRNADGVDAEPETDENALGENHTITAHTFDQFGVEYTTGTVVNFEFFSGSPSDTDGNTPDTPDDTCTTTGGNSNCSITYSQSTTAGTDRLCVWTNSAPAMIGNNENGTCDGEGLTDADDDPQNPDAPENPPKDDVDVVEKMWGDPLLNCRPEQSTGQVNRTHTVTCEVESNGAPLGGVEVDAEAIGANDADGDAAILDPDFTCTTDGTGACSFDHVGGNQVGTTTYRAWIDADKQDSSNEADNAEGRNAQLVPGDTPEEDITDVVEREWVPDPERLISLFTNKHKVKKAEKVRFFGQVDGHPACEAGQEVRLQVRNRKGKGFTTVATVVTEPDGDYEFRLAVMRTTTYRTLAPKTEFCRKAKSFLERVRVT